MTFQIPMSLSSKFKEFFMDFDQKLEDLGIRSYGISITTLEEVFLRVGHGNHIGQETKNENLIGSPDRKIRPENH